MCIIESDFDFLHNKRYPLIGDKREEPEKWETPRKETDKSHIGNSWENIKPSKEDVEDGEDEEDVY